MGPVFNACEDEPMKLRTFAVRFTLLSILAAGNVVLATEGTLVVTGDTRLEEDHRGSIVIEADGVTLDCDGRLVNGEGLTDENLLIGIVVDDRQDVTISNCRITNFDIGISLFLAGGCNLTGNKLNFNRDGLDIDSTGGCAIEKNSFRHNQRHGIFCSESAGSTFSDNVTTSNGGHGFLLSNCLSGVLIQNYAKHNGLSGFLIEFLSDRNLFWKNVARDNNGAGFFHENSNENIYLENEASGNVNYDAMIDLESEPSWFNLFVNNDFERTFQLHRVIQHEE